MGLFATEGVIGVSSCLDSITPIAIDYELYLHSDHLSDSFKYYGLTYEALGDALQICDNLPDSDKKRVKELMLVFEKPALLAAEMTKHFLSNEQ